MTTPGRSKRSILDRIVGTSVSFNGLLIPASALTTSLGRYVDNLFVWNDDEIYKVSLVGSAVPIRFSGRYFLLCTNHQLRGRHLESVSLLGRDGQNLITSSGVRHFSNESSPHYLDLAAFDFTEPCEMHLDLKERFFDLREIPPDARNTDIVVAMVAGFPSKDQKYELEEKNHIGKFKRIVLCHPDPSSYDPALLCLRASEPFDFYLTAGRGIGVCCSGRRWRISCLFCGARGHGRARSVPHHQGWRYLPISICAGLSLGTRVLDGGDLEFTEPLHGLSDNQRANKLLGYQSDAAAALDPPNCTPSDRACLAPPKRPRPPPGELTEAA